ncbi:MAG TPA: hypothetical protein VFO55_11945 [Gemmatimonadaceae bacterium]|nr:hypothetical protein [Gemmatimonadaceae bacterium]
MATTTPPGLVSLRDTGAPTVTNDAQARHRDRGDRAWLAYVVVFAAVCVMVGVYWDISWHMSIGRDSFWTPAHLLIQSGGLLAGLTSGFVAIKTTFWPSARDVGTGVRLWGFRAPLGAWVCIWGCFAMLASAPFDDWWHNAYGLDVKIVSPPHTVLALGIYAIVNGGLLLSLASQNRAGDESRARFTMLYLIAGGLLVMNFAIFLSEYSFRFLQHGEVFYHFSAIFYPFALVALARGARHRWPATIAAAFYMGIMLALMWIVQLFPATPMLGPIYQDITHMVGMAWPLWLVVPAAGIDFVRQRLGGRFPSIIEAVILGLVFSVLFVAVQWPWASFMVESPLARNAFFNADNFVYWAQPSYVERSHRFISDGSRFVPAAVETVLIASLSAWAGLGWGTWMSKVRR